MLMSAMKCFMSSHEEDDSYFENISEGKDSSKTSSETKVGLEPNYAAYRKSTIDLATYFYECICIWKGLIFSSVSFS